MCFMDWNLERIRLELPVNAIAQDTPMQNTKNGSACMSHAKNKFAGIIVPFSV